MASAGFDLDYRQLFRGLPGLYLVLDPEFTVVDASDAMLAATMTRRDRVVGHNIFEVYPDDPAHGGEGPARLLESLERVRRERVSDVMAVQRYDPRTPDGGYEPRFWSPVNVPLLDGDGRLRWIIHRVEDVTDYVREKALGDARLQEVGLMEAEVYRSAQDVRVARDEARRASAAKTKFLAAVSHDLRQPIQAILLFLELFKGVDLPTAIAKPLELIAGSVAALREMLDGLLDLARLDAGMVRPEVRAFRIDRLLADMEREFAPQAEAKGLVFAVEAAPAGVRSDPLLIGQILRNLVSNAVKYTAAGAVTIGAATRDGAVTVSVADTGIGIAADQFANIFEDFYQVDNPSRDRARGLGLGLGTVKRTAELLGHRIDLSSRPGEGSAFTLTLPAAEADVIEDEPTPPEADVPLRDAPLAARALKGRKVMLVEDEHPVAAAMARIMERWGIHVVTAHSVEEEEDILARLPAPPDLLVSDFRLPGERTGRDAINALRRRWPGVPAILVTGDTAPDRLLEARAGGCRLLHKPLTARQLQQALVDEL